MAKITQQSLVKAIKKNLTSFILGLIIVLILVILGVSQLAGAGKPGEKFRLSKLFDFGKEEAPTPTPEVKKYKVQEGDTLCNIGERIYGSCEAGYDIARANKITQPDALEVGTELILPQDVAMKEEGDVSSVSTITPSPQAPATGGNQATKYTVKQGDTLEKIAQAIYKDGSRWQVIAQANNIFNPDHVEVGMVLTIPR